MGCCDDNEFIEKEKKTTPCPRKYILVLVYISLPLDQSHIKKTWRAVIFMLYLSHNSPGININIVKLTIVIGVFVSLKIGTKIIFIKSLMSVLETKFYKLTHKHTHIYIYV